MRVNITFDVNKPLSDKDVLKLSKAINSILTCSEKNKKVSDIHITHTKSYSPEEFRQLPWHKRLLYYMQI